MFFFSYYVVLWFCFVFSVDESSNFVLNIVSPLVVLGVFFCSFTVCLYVLIFHCFLCVFICNSISHIFFHLSSISYVALLVFLLFLFLFNA